LFTCGLAVLLWIGTAEPARADTETLYSNKYGHVGTEVIKREEGTIVSIQYYDPCGRLREEQDYRHYAIMLKDLRRITYYSPAGTSEVIVDFEISPTSYSYGRTDGSKNPVKASEGNKIIDQWLHEPYEPCPHPKTTTGGVKTAVLFRTGEVQLNFYGQGGVGHGQVNETETEVVTRTETVTETTVVKETVLKDVPGKPGLTPVDEDVPVKTTKHVSTKEHIRTTRNRAAIQGGFGGAGAEAKYFVTENIGLGLKADWLDGESSIGTTLGTLTARFPMGANAPYLFGGAGVQFGDRTGAVGELGGGIEHRFSPACGVFVDAAWMFAEHENAAVFRAGVSLVFGPQELPPPSKK
jgi:hypothetical protein